MPFLAGPQPPFSTLIHTTLYYWILKKKVILYNFNKLNKFFNILNLLYFKIFRFPKLPAMGLCLGEPPVRFLCCCSYLMCIFICRCSSFCCCCSSFISRLLYHVTGTPPWLLRSVQASTSSELYPNFFWLPFLFHLPWGLRFSLDVFYPQAFFTLCSFPIFFAQPAFIKASLGAGSYSLKFAGLHIDPWNTDPAHLFVWFTVIHNLLYILNLYLYMSILQKFYLWWKLW